jgi:hypothetical protein
VVVPVAVDLIVSPFLSAFNNRISVKSAGTKCRKGTPEAKTMAYLWKLRLVSSGIWRNDGKPQQEPGVLKK